MFLPLNYFIAALWGCRKEGWSFGVAEIFSFLYLFLFSLSVLVDETVFKIFAEVEN